MSPFGIVTRLGEHFDGMDGSRSFSKFLSPESGGMRIQQNKKLLTTASSSLKVHSMPRELKEVVSAIVPMDLSERAAKGSAKNTKQTKMEVKVLGSRYKRF